MGWLSYGHRRKLPQSSLKFVDVCHVCGETFSLVKNKHSLLLGHDSSVWPDYTLALEDITGRVTPSDGLPKVVNGSCHTLLQHYG